MYQLVKEFCFEAAHQLNGLEPGHPCGRLHGHSYRVQVVLEGTALNAVGFLRDYRDLNVVKTFLDREWDHRTLNRGHVDSVLVGPASTTSEALAEWLYGRFITAFPELVAIRISETAKTWCEYRP